MELVFFDRSPVFDVQGVPHLGEGGQGLDYPLDLDLGVFAGGEIHLHDDEPLVQVGLLVAHLFETNLDEPLARALHLGEAAQEIGPFRGELAYLANVLVEGASHPDGRRFLPTEAAEAALATVTLGLELEAMERTTDKGGRSETSNSCAIILETCAADILFRSGSSFLIDNKITTAVRGLVVSSEELSRL
jgi:hypothetical protein